MYVSAMRLRTFSARRAGGEIVLQDEQGLDREMDQNLFNFLNQVINNLSAWITKVETKQHYLSTIYVYILVKFSTYSLSFFAVP